MPSGALGRNRAGHFHSPIDSVLVRVSMDEGGHSPLASTSFRQMTSQSRLLRASLLPTLTFLVGTCVFAIDRERTLATCEDYLCLPVVGDLTLLITLLLSVALGARSLRSHGQGAVWKTAGTAGVLMAVTYWVMTDIMLGTMPDSRMLTVFLALIALMYPVLYAGAKAAWRE